MIEQETFWTLLHNTAHWEFELFLMIVIDGIIGALVWPFIKRHFKKDAQREAKCETTHKNCIDLDK